MHERTGDVREHPEGPPERPAVPPPVVPSVAPPPVVPGAAPPPVVPGASPQASVSQATVPRTRPVAPLEPLAGLGPGRPLPPEDGGPLASAAPPGGWGWRHAIAGLALAYLPQLALSSVALLGGATDADTGAATLSSAVALIFGSLVVYGFQVFAAWLFSARFAGGMRQAWGLRRPGKAFFWTIPLGLFAVYAVSVVHDVYVHPEQQQIVSEFPRSAGGAAAFIVLAVLMAPLFEEVFFRGFLFRGLANSWGWMWGAVVSATVFSLAHLQLSVFVPLFALGFVLAWVYQRTGSLWTSITLHAVFNGISVAAWILIS